jgi:hypothetical protein
MYSRKLISLALVLGLGVSVGISSEALASGKYAAKSGSQSQSRGIGNPGSQMDSTQLFKGNMEKQKNEKIKKSKEQKLSGNMIRYQLNDNEIYGHEMMSAEERNQYRERLNAAQSDKKWAQLRAEHQVEMQTRARSQGIELNPPVFGEHLMTTKERNRYEDRLSRANSDAQRNRIREEHQILIQERARELGIDPPSALN